MQRNLTVTHLVGPIEYTKIYPGVRGTGQIDTAEETFRLRLRTTHLEGDRFETEIELSITTPEPFVTPMVEFAPDGPEYREHSFIGRELSGGYVLSASGNRGNRLPRPGNERPHLE